MTHMKIFLINIITYNPYNIYIYMIYIYDIFLLVYFSIITVVFSLICNNSRFESSLFKIRVVNLISVTIFVFHLDEIKVTFCSVLVVVVVNLDRISPDS